jgi:hypothetical protein
MSGIGTLISAADYNTIIGEPTSTSSNAFNTVWGTGSGKFGYGQTPIAKLVEPNIAIDDRIKLDAWTNLVTAVNTAKTHLGISTSAITIPNVVSGAVAGIIRYDTLYKITQSVKDIYTNHLNSAMRDSSAGNDYRVVNSSTWRDAIEFTFIVTFANGDAARYFFNLGGQLALTFGAAPGLRINAIMSQLASSAGTLVISSPSVETINIVGVEYKGVTKVGGTNPTAVPKEFTGQRYGVISYNDLSSSIGYYGMTSSDQVIFRQSVGSVPSTELRYNYYDGSYIQVSAKTNGQQGVNGDNGNVITIKVLWDQVPNGLQVAAGTSTTLSVRKPLLPVGMTQSWGTPVVNGTVSGS